MRILVSRISPDEAIGGAELSARDIARSLIKLGHQPLFATNLGSFSQVTKGLKSQHVAALPNPHSKKASSLFYPIKLAWLFFRYLTLVIKFQPDVLNPQSRDDQVVATLVGKITRCPVVWRDPGDLVPQLQFPITSLSQKLNRHLQVWAIRHADYIFTLNDDELGVIQRLVPALKTSKISVTESNILFSDYHIAPEPKMAGQIIIGTSARLDKHKGIQYLIAALTELQPKVKTTIKLLIAGDGPYKQALKKQAQGLRNVEFLGHQKDISDLLNKLDIFVQPSEFEGWGRSVREAMYFGLPVIGSNVGGIKKQIQNGKTGLLIEPGNVVQLESAVSKLIQSSEIRADIGEAARKSVVNQGDWVETVRQRILPIFTKQSRDTQQF